MESKEIILSFILIWAFVGFYYLFNIWSKPSVLLIGFGFTLGLLIITLLKGVKFWAKGIGEKSNG